MILVDTSVWIRSLAGHPPYSTKLRELLVNNQVVGHELVHGELFIGDRGGRQEVVANYELLPWAATIKHSEVVAFVRDRELHGRGISWIDVHLLASALVARAPIWTADTRFAAIARELGVAYEPFPHKVR